MLNVSNRSESPAARQAGAGVGREGCLYGTTKRFMPGWMGFLPSAYNEGVLAALWRHGPGRRFPSSRCLQIGLAVAVLVRAQASIWILERWTLTANRHGQEDVISTPLLTISRVQCTLSSIRGRLFLSILP